MTPRLAIAAAALLMAVAVALGAFGAHGLKTRIAPEMLALWTTGVTYHAWHALALLLAGVLMRDGFGGVAARWAAWLFVGGIVLFSGSLYLMALGAPSALGFATPLGGAAFIAAWIALAIGVVRG